MIPGRRGHAGTGRPAARPRGQQPATIEALARRFPPRPAAARWEATGRTRTEVEARLSTSPLLVDVPDRIRAARMIGVAGVLDWLAAQPGDTWQDRWVASGAGAERGKDWRRLVTTGGPTGTISTRVRDHLGTGLLTLICCDVLRPDPGWLLTSRSPRKLPAALAATRDRSGFAELQRLCDRAGVSIGTSGPALDRVAAIVAGKGGVVADITVGDCLQLLQIADAPFTDGHYNSPFFYQLLHSMGSLGADAPPTIRAFNARGQRDPAQLVDRYQLSCRPVRDLLVDYLTERRARLDYSTLEQLARTLACLFWADLEAHHPASIRCGYRGRSRQVGNSDCRSRPIPAASPLPD